MSKLNLPFEGLGDGSMDTSAPNCSPLDTSMDQSIGSAAPIFGAPSAGAFLPRPLALASYAALTTSVDRGKKAMGIWRFRIIPWIGHFLHGHHHPPRLKWINYSKLNEQILRWHDKVSWRNPFGLKSIEPWGWKRCPEFHATIFSRYSNKFFYYKVADV